jgi:hypothetical protein
MYGDGILRLAQCLGSQVFFQREWLQWSRRYNALPQGRRRKAAFAISRMDNFQ